MVVKLFIVNAPGDTNNLALAIFNNSFTNGVQNYTYIPVIWDFSGNFSYSICLISEGFMIYIMFTIYF